MQLNRTKIVDSPTGWLTLYGSRMRLWCLKRISLELKEKPHCTVAVSPVGAAGAVEIELE